MLCGSCEFSNEPGIKAPLGVTPATAAAARFTSPDAYTPKHLAEKILISKSALEGRLRS
jgi:hypothetical protein